MGERPNKRVKQTTLCAPEGLAADTGIPSAETFWDEYISHRKPTLLLSVPKTKHWNTEAWLEGFPHYLKDRAVLPIPLRALHMVRTLLLHRAADVWIITSSIPVTPCRVTVKSMWSVVRMSREALESAVRRACSLEHS
jgi:hypothetical protein